MKIEQTVILWNSESDIEFDLKHGRNDTIKNVKILPLGQDDKKYHKITGGCWYKIKKMTEEQKTRFLFIEAMKMIIRDGVDPQMVHKTFCEIREYRDGLSIDTPVPEHLKEKFKSETEGDGEWF